MRTAGEGLRWNGFDGASKGEEVVEEVGHEVHDPAADADKLGYNFGAERGFFNGAVHACNGREDLGDVFDIDDYPGYFAG
jgi:hypothetical protein